MQLVVYLIGAVIIILVRIILGGASLYNLTLDEIIFYSNSAIVWLIPAIIVHSFDRRSRWYLFGINLDIYAIRDILHGALFAFISVIFIVCIAFIWGADFSISEINISKIFESSFYILNFAIVEELVFRGFIFQYFLYKSKNPIFVVIISSVLFSAAHYFNSGADILVYINTFFAGILFSLMYLKTHSMWIQTSFHFIWNWATIVLFTKSYFYESLISKDIVFTVFFKKEHEYWRDFLFGSTYSFESGILCTFVLILISYFVLKYIKPSYNINADIFKYEYK